MVLRRFNAIRSPEGHKLSLNRHTNPRHHADRQGAVDGAAKANRKLVGAWRNIRDRREVHHAEQATPLCPIARLLARDDVPATGSRIVQ